jgi:hypothetical protein
MFGESAGEVEHVTGEVGDSVGSHGQRAEEFSPVGGDDETKQRRLIAEVRVEAFFAGVGRFGDAVDACSSKAVLGEFGAGCGQDFTTQLEGVSHSLSITERTSSFGTLVVSASLSAGTSKTGRSSRQE